MEEQKTTDQTTTVDTTPTQTNPVEDAVVSVSLKTSDLQGIYDGFDEDVVDLESAIAVLQERIDFNQSLIATKKALIDVIKAKKALLLSK